MVGKPSARRRAWSVGALVLAVAAATACSSTPDAGTTSSAPSSGTTAATATSAADSSVCGYYYEWKSAWKFALQPDPHAAYSYVIPKVTTDPVAYQITGDFPYAPWTSWTIYNAEAQPFSLATDSKITPDAGSVNPFVVGTPVLSPTRSFTLLVLPQGVDTTAIAEPLRAVPASNIIASPTSGKAFIIANRVYNAFPGYNRGGAAGPTNTAFPVVRAVNYETGEPVDCGPLNLVPNPQAPTDMPTNAVDADPSDGVLTLTDGTRIAVGSQGSRRSAEGGDAAVDGAEYAPELDPDLIEFTRPPLLPGADVSSIPPPDNCAGYLGAATSTTKIGLIRMPHVAVWFDTDGLTPETPFEQEETTYISFTQYGSGVSFYDPGKPASGSLGNGELKVDASGGSTILVWPPNLSKADQQKVFDLAEKNGWALMRGGEQGKITTANLFVRLKGASPSYQGGYTPTSDRQGVPCYFDDNTTASWTQLTGGEYVASAQNIGTGAPQGVNCTVAEVTGGQCLSRLKAYIQSTGGSYTASS
jgi:hypothetical protein